MTCDNDINIPSALQSCHVLEFSFSFFFVLKNLGSVLLRFRMVLRRTILNCVIVIAYCLFNQLTAVMTNANDVIVTSQRDKLTRQWCIAS